MNNQDSQRRHYNKIAEKYIIERSNPSTLTYRDTLWNYFIDYIIKEIDPKKVVWSLDAMCGNAEASKRLAIVFKKSKFEAFDYSDEMVSYASKSLLSKSGRLLVKKKDIVTMNYNEKYDLVILIGGLHHVYKNADEVVENIYRSLKSGGVFINFEPTNNFIISEKVREFIYKRNRVFEASTEHDFKLREYNQLLSSAGFKITKQIYPGLLGYILYYNPDAFPFLNIGNSSFAKMLCKLDVYLGKTIVGRVLSFNTFTIAKK